jgi:PDZ domain-containing secreted protein
MGRFLRYCTLGDVYGTGDLHLAVDGSGSILVAGSVGEIGDLDKRLLSGDYMGSTNPGAFLIRLVE